MFPPPCLYYYCKHIQVRARQSLARDEHSVAPLLWWGAVVTGCFWSANQSRGPYLIGPPLRSNNIVPMQPVADVSHVPSQPSSLGRGKYKKQHRQSFYQLRLETHIMFCRRIENSSYTATRADLRTLNLVALVPRSYPFMLVFKLCKTVFYYRK